ncbi:MAG: glutathione S-transferase family protein, partial [Alphaproteobacteria bacterium]|nr:glutathione S-transferase family protein [Alphaproteobacteria bacterium]
MGKLIDGVWLDDAQMAAAEATNTDKSGAFVRAESVIRHWVTPDGEPGPSGEGGFKAEAGRYHLYVALNCPWAHRALIFRILKQLQDVISISYVRPRRSDQGWVFDADDAFFKDDLFGKSALHEIYTQAQPDYTGRVTVPVLWDIQRQTMVSNESAEIIRMLNSAFDAFTDDKTDYYPAAQRDEIDALNERIYNTINNGVYRTGFARSQAAYDEAVTALFDTLDMLDDRLAVRRYLMGDQQTEADWRLFPTLARFDVAYVGAFKCNIRRIADYANLWPYARDLYQTPGIAETVRHDIYKQGYYSKSELRNPLGIIPAGPE